MPRETDRDQSPNRVEQLPYGVGAVLYEDRPDTPDDERRLHHITDILVSARTGYCRVEIKDGTHTTRTYYHSEDVLADFEPAGWQFPPSRKPTYHLTRNVGAYDKQDRMLEDNDDAE
jgi:hypothetical protein